MTMTDHGRLADESGYVAVWTVVIGGALMVAGGVVYDSADKANEARRVTMVANEAGRAAAADRAVAVAAVAEAIAVAAEARPTEHREVLPADSAVVVAAVAAVAHAPVVHP